MLIDNTNERELKMTKLELVKDIATARFPQKHGNFTDTMWAWRDEMMKKSKSELLDIHFNEMNSMHESNIWQTAKVFTKANGFGVGMEVLENRIIDIRPDESHSDALIRQGFEPKQSRIEII